MSKHLYNVYLAGPITGLAYTAATDWREYVKSHIRNDILVCSPLRAKRYLENETNIADSYENWPLSSSKGLTTRDRFDVMRCDLLFVNLLGTTKVSIGTVMEIGWADMLRKPIVLLIEDEGNIHDHAMIRECAGFRLNNLDDGIILTERILSEG